MTADFCGPSRLVSDFFDAHDKPQPHPDGLYCAAIGMQIGEIGPCGVTRFTGPGGEPVGIIGCVGLPYMTILLSFASKAANADALKRGLSKACAPSAVTQEIHPAMDSDGVLFPLQALHSAEQIVSIFDAAGKVHYRMV